MDISKFKEYAEATHKEFLDKLGMQIDKVVADHLFNVESCSSKIRYILETLKALDIISSYTYQNEGDYISYIIKKNEFNNNIKVSTNGRHIVVSQVGVDFNTSFSRPHNCKWDVGSSVFDWEEFAKDLLGQIHGFIYRQSEAYAVKIEGLFQSPDKEGQ
jgi:hypothetical protein